MEPRIITREAFNVLGIQIRIEPMSADYTAIWENQYMPHGPAVRERAAGEGCYGVYFASEEPGKVDFVAGMAVGEIGEVPEGLTMRQVPAAQFAVFDCRIPELGQTWRAIYADWLPQSDQYAADEDKPCFELFPPGVHEGKAPASIYVPVKDK